MAKDLLYRNQFGTIETTPYKATAMEQMPTTMEGKAGRALTVRPDETGYELSDMGVMTDENVKISAGDTSAGKLETKILAGTNILISKENGGGNEVLRITGAFTDEKVKATSSGASGTLEDVMVAGANVTLTINGDNKLEVSSSDTDVKVSATDTAGGKLQDKLVAGANVTITKNSDGSGVETLTVASTGGVSTFEDLTDTPSSYTGQAGKIVVVNGTEDGLIFTDAAGDTDEKVKYSATDSTAGYLADKIVAGTNVTVEEVDTAGVKQIKINSTPGLVISNELHVAVNGNDTTGTGSMENPFATITKALTEAGNNDTIVLHTGDYTENVSIDHSVNIKTTEDTFCRIVGDFTITAIAPIFVTVSGLRLVGQYINTTDFSNVKFTNSKIERALVTDTAITISGAQDGNTSFMNCTVKGVANIAYTNGQFVQFVGGYLEYMNLALDGVSIVQVVDVLALGSVTHTNGYVYLDNVHLVKKNGSNDSIVSTADAGGINAVILGQVNLQQADGSIGKINKTGTCPYYLADTVRNPEQDTLSGVRAAHVRFPEDVAGFTYGSLTGTSLKETLQNNSLLKDWVSEATYKQNQTVIYSGVLYRAKTDHTAVSTTPDSDTTNWLAVSGGSGGSSTFVGLTDTPASYTGQGGKLLAVNVGEDAVEFIDAPSTDTKQIKISAADTTEGYVEDKLVAGTGITITKNNTGANETVTIAATGGGGSATIEQYVRSNAQVNDIVNLDLNTATVAVVDARKFTAGDTPTTVQQNFNNGDATSFEDNPDVVLFDGQMKLRTTRTDTLSTSVVGAGAYTSKTISLSDYKSISMIAGV